MRGFERVKDNCLRNEGEAVPLPRRSSERSAGYDLVCPADTVIPPREARMIWTDVKAFMEPDEFLLLAVRSSVGVKRQLMMANTIGIIDASYYGNPENDGNIGVCLYNYGEKEVKVERGERFAQGVFVKYQSVGDEGELAGRAGGFGSSGRKD